MVALWERLKSFRHKVDKVTLTLSEIRVILYNVPGPILFGPKLALAIIDN